MVGTGSPVSFRRRPPLTFGAALIVSLPRPQNPHVGTRVRWGPARHDNHEGQRMTPGAPTDGARSRLPGHRGSTEAGTTLKDSGQSTRASKGVCCVSPLTHEAGAGHRSHCVVQQGVVPQGQASDAHKWLHTVFTCARRGPQALACGPLPHGCDAQSHSIAFGDPDGLMTVTRPPYQPRPRQWRPCERGSDGSRRTRVRGAPGSEHRQQPR